MKKIAIITALCLSCISIGIAQENTTDNREKFQFGIKGGVNYSNVYDESGDEFRADPKTGIAAGIFAEVPLGKYLGLQPALMVSQKGFRAHGKSLGYDYDFTRTTTFIDVPVLLSLKPSEFFSIVAGPEISFLVHQRDEFTSSLNSFVLEEEFKNDNVRKNIFGFVGGLDINLKHVTLGARVCWDLQNNNGDGTSSTPRYKNAWFQATIGYKFFH